MSWSPSGHARHRAEFVSIGNNSVHILVEVEQINATVFQICIVEMLHVSGEGKPREVELVLRSFSSY